MHKNGRCFTGDTLVPTKHGYTAIKEIQKGDGILSRDEKTGRTGFKKFEDVFIRTVHTIYHVWLDGKEEIKTTAYHPVYVQEQGWVTAINLREGDTLETMEGTACITKIVKERHEEPVTVYNLAVKDWVSYFVGQVRVYVHNGNGYKSGNKAVDDLINNLKDTTSRKGTAKNFESSGGYQQTLKDFEALNPVNIKDIQTQYGPGKVGTLSDGTTIVTRRGSTVTGQPTLEIRVSNSKIYKIRY